MLPIRLDRFSGPIQSAWQALAVRRRDPEVLVVRPLALVVGDLNENRLKSLIVTAPREDSANRLDADLSGLFEKIAKIAGHPATVNLMM